MTFWPLTNSDFPTDQTFHQLHDLYTELDLHRIMSGFHGAFATGVASQQGTLTLPDTWFRPPFWDLLMLQLLRPNSSNLPFLYSTFHLEYPLVLSRFCLVPIGIPTMCWYTMPSNCTYMFSVRKVKASHNSVQDQHLYESYFLLLKILPYVKYRGKILTLCRNTSWPETRFCFDKIKHLVHLNRSIFLYTNQNF